MDDLLRKRCYSLLPHFYYLKGVVRDTACCYILPPKIGAGKRKLGGSAAAAAACVGEEGEALKGRLGRS